MNQNNTNRRKYIMWTFLPIVFAMCIQVAVMIMAIQGYTALAIYRFKGSSLADFYIMLMQMASSPWFDGLIYGVYSLIGIIVFGILYKKMFVEEKKNSFLKESVNLPATIGGFVLFTIGMQYVCVYLISALASAFPSWLETYTQLIESSGLGSSMAFITALYALLLGPICEELVFRGLTYKAAEKYLPIPAAIAIQAFLFGAYHMNMMQGSYAFVLGLGLGYIMYLYDDIVLTIIFHVAFNFVGTVGSEYLPMGGTTIAGFFACLLAALVITYLSIILLRKGSKKVNNPLDFTDI